MSNALPTLPKQVQQAFRAAAGWLNLDNWREARQELDLGAAAYLDHPLIAGLYLEILSRGGQWREMQVRAEDLARRHPAVVRWLIALAYATRRAESISAARQVLLKARELFPHAALVSYNLACYEAQLGDLPAAKSYLLEAARMDADCARMAMRDQDLEPIRNYAASLLKNF